MSHDHLSLSEVLAIHFHQIEAYGGLHGERDRGAIEAALARPQSGYYRDLVEEAAALWESLAQNHPFLDGNKRTAFACTVTFLRINGVKFAPGKADAIDFILGLYDRDRFCFEELEPWLRAHTRGRI